MSDLVTDIILRCGKADAETLREIYRKEIQRPIFTDDERELLMNAFGNRCSEINAAEVGIQEPRWK